MRDRLPGCEDANRALESEILRIDSDHSDLTTDYLSGNLLILEHPAISWLRECINQATIVYIRRLGIDYQLDWQLQGWTNVNRFGDYHNLHNHPHAWLSGTYYVSPRHQRAACRPSGPESWCDFLLRSKSTSQHGRTSW